MNVLSAKSYVASKAGELMDPFDAQLAVISNAVANPAPIPQ